MNDESKLASGLQKAKKRLQQVLDVLEADGTLGEVRESIEKELQSVREFGIDIPEFDEGAPGTLMDLCGVVDIDPPSVTSIDVLMSAVRTWAMRRRMEAQVDAAAVEPVSGSEWSAWFYKKDWRIAWAGKKLLPESTFKDWLGKHGQTDRHNIRRCRFRTAWLKEADKATPSKAE
jgi:hypothetical protein